MLTRLFLACWLIIPVTATAQSYDTDFWRNNRFGIAAGIYLPSVNTKIRVDSATDQGTSIDLESDLGLDDNKSTPIIQGYWRFARKHALTFEYFDLKRDGRTTLQADIEWDDTVYPIDTEVDSFFNTTVLRLGYRYSFIHSPKQEVGFVAGIHAIELDTGIRDVNGGVSAEENGLIVPLPNLGGMYRYRFAPKWTVAAELDWFGLTINDIDGEMWNLAGWVNWMPWENFGFSLGYALFKIDVEAKDSDLRGLFEYQYNGPMLMFTFRT